MADYQATLEVAVEAVRQAARVTQAVQQDLVTAETLEKKDRSPVTVADYASQAVVCRILADKIGAQHIVGEENADELRTDENTALRQSVTEHVGRVIPSATEADVLDWIDHGGFDGQGENAYWTLDPIDGTKGFLRGEQYAIALALIEDGQLQVGVLGCPNLPGPDGQTPGVLMVAVRGRGAQMLPLTGSDLEGATPIRVSDIANAADARFCESVESGHSNQSQSANIAQTLGMTAEPVRMDSQAKYATVARGDASIYLRLPTRADYQEKIWDHAAGAIVVTEAGGRVTDVNGKPLDFSIGRTLAQNKGVVATNGDIHDAVLNAVQNELR